MRRSSHTSHWVAFAVAVGCIALATVLTAATPAAVDRTGAPAAHRCLVMTGSGDAAFVKNFNSYTATGLPSGARQLAYRQSGNLYGGGEAREKELTPYLIEFYVLLDPSKSKKCARNATRIMLHFLSSSRSSPSI